MKLFENRRLKGAVSIFLVIITIPCLLLSAVLIDGSRLSSARAMTQEATDLAAASVLASYNQTLKDEFGLFSMEESDPAVLEEIFKESLNATLLAHGMTADAEYSERLWDIMKTTVTGGKSYMGESFLNLYDFSLDSCQVTPLYSLANQDVLENQMVEYAKFRGIYVMADRLDLFRHAGEIQKEAEKNKESSEVMEDKMDVDEDNAAADQALKALRDAIPGLNEGIRAVETAEETYLECLRARMEQLRIQNTDTEDELTREQREQAGDYEAARTALLGAVSEVRARAEMVRNKAKSAENAINAAIGRLEGFKSSNGGKADGNETVQGLMNDADDNIKNYKENYLPSVEALLNDSALTKLAGDTGLKNRLDTVLEEIGDAITAYTDEIDEMLEEAGETDIVIQEYFYYFLDSEEKTDSISEAVSGGSGTRYYKPALREVSDYFRGKSWDPEDFKPSGGNIQASESKISRDFAKETSKQLEDSDKGAEGEAEQGTVDDAVYQSRPSKTFDPEAEKSAGMAFYNETNNLSGAKNAVSGSGDSFLLQIGEAARDDILSFSYMMGTFKTRLTGVEKFSASGMSQKDKNSFYMPKWRYAHADGELDMRFAPKKDRNTVLRSEIEYLIYGNKSDKANEAAVYATIFAERLANNMIAMYMEKKVVNPACHAAAAVASAATGGLVPEPVFFWIFLTAWATAETVIELDYLISGGYKIPLFKTNKNILLNEVPTASGDGLITNYGESGIFVSYEDYLMLLMLLAGKEKRIMRSADLIEMNMKENGETDFTMAKAYTYLRAESGLSIRYLFGDVMPFSETYEGQGYSGRISYTNTIYQGY